MQLRSSQMISEFKEYFQRVDQIQQYLGTDRTSQDAAEILPYIIYQSRKTKLFLNTVSEWLYLPKRNVSLAIRFLKDLGLISTCKRAYIYNEEGINHLNLAEDEKFRLYAYIKDLEDWYSAKNQKTRDNFLSFLHGITCEREIELETKPCSRRLLAKCVCFNQPVNCSLPTSYIIKRDLRILTEEVIDKITSEDTYVKELKETIPQRTYVYERQSILRKVRQIYLGKMPRGKAAVDTHTGLWAEARRLVEEAKEHGFKNRWERDSFLYRMVIQDPVEEKFGRSIEEILQNKVNAGTINHTTTRKKYRIVTTRR